MTELLNGPGRPVEYDEADWESVIDRMAEGMSMRAIGELPGYPDVSTITRKIEQDRDFAARAYRIRVIAASDKLTQATEEIRNAPLDPVAITKAVKLADSLAREAMAVMPRKQPAGMALSVPGTSGGGNETADGVAIDPETLQLQYDEIGKARGVAVSGQKNPLSTSPNVIYAVVRVLILQPPTQTASRLPIAKTWKYPGPIKLLVAVFTVLVTRSQWRISLIRQTSATPWVTQN